MIRLAHCGLLVLQKRCQRDQLQSITPLEGGGVYKALAVFLSSVSRQGQARCSLYTPRCIPDINKQRVTSAQAKVRSRHLAARGSMAAMARTLLAVCCALLVSAVLADSRATVAAVVAAAAPKPLVAVPTPAPAPKPVTLHDKVVAALRASNHYGALSGFLDSVAANSLIKEGTTLFAPDDGAFSGLNMNSSSLLTTTLDYHVATEVYTYQQLSNMPLNATIETSAPNVVILVTSTGKNGLRLDNVAVSDPDIYSDGQISVQGISAIMDTAKYNKGLLPPAAAPAPLVKPVPAPAPSIITTPSTPKTSTGTTPTTNAAPALALTTALNAMLPIFAVSFLVALL